MRVADLKTRSVTPHNFSMNPRAPIQRASFPVNQGNTLTMGASRLVPIYCEPVMPGDMFNIQARCVARTAIPIVPILDNWKMDIFFFYTPNRILWENWEKFMGAQDNPGDSISFLIPQVESDTGGWPIGSIGDYMGYGTVGQIDPANFQSASALPMRAHNKIYNDWFRDENLIGILPENTGDGPDNWGDYGLVRRNKRFNYFTGALPFLQKGPAVSIPLGTTAPLVSTGLAVSFDNPGHNRTGSNLMFTASSALVDWSNSIPGAGPANFGPAGTPMPSLEVNLTAAASAQVNLMRTAVATQQLLERDARGGTRYVETIFAHWGVRPLDYRLDRPEYIGGGQIDVTINAIPQTSETTVDSPQGNLAATGFINGKSGFSYAATEHGYIIGYACVTADLRYSQGLPRHLSYRTRYDFPFPEFANLGEQAILNKEIFAIGSLTGGLGAADQDNQVFGYIPRYDECRHFPSKIGGLFRPTAANNLAYWHTSEQFATLPALNPTFITDTSDTTMYRNFAAGALTEDQQFLCDFAFTGRVARPLPTHAVPGLKRF